MQKKNLLLITGMYWFLLLYIIAALLWWFIALEKQNDFFMQTRIAELNPQSENYNKKLLEIKEHRQRKHIQYVGEGLTFLVIILVGAVLVYRSTKKQIAFSRQQQNFMMAITHELKTPIAVAKLNLETFQKRTLPDNTKANLLKATLSELERLNQLCNNVLYSAQLQSGKVLLLMEEINFSKLLYKVIQQIKNRYQNILIHTSIDESVVIKGDELALEILISNLIENAIKYAGIQKPVDISLQKHRLQVLLEIKDQGPGIADDEKQKVFEMFYRTGNESTRNAKGTGLGLFLCKKIVTNHKGSITIKNNKPVGTIISTVFPIV